MEGAIAALAARQWGVFSVGQLVGLGLTAAAVRKRAAAGRLHRIHRGVYSLVPRTLLTREGHWMAAVLACGEGAVLSHRSAATLHELRASSGARRIDVTVPGRTNRERARIAIHRSMTLAPADVTTAKHIPCTTVARTLLDLAEVLDRRTLERAFDQAEVMNAFDLRKIEDQLARNPTRPAAARVQELLQEHYIGGTVTASELEERFLALCRDAGVPRPDVNAWVLLGDGDPAIKGDFVWREQRVIVELDGDETHRTRQAFERDRRRDQRAAAAGWRVVRVTWRQLVSAPHEVLATLLSLLQL